MDQMKIGKFIADCRKRENLTQMQLAEILGVTDRAVSKWETGKSMPDSSIMIELCKTLRISVTELLKGEKIEMENSEKQLESLTIELVRQKERADKQMLAVEIAIGLISVFALFGFVFSAAFIPMENWIRITLIAFGFVLGLVGIFFALRIEQVAGYYKCRHCNYTYVPTYKSVLFTMHTGRTRYMKCPKCGKMSWQKKVVSKD